MWLPCGGPEVSIVGLKLPVPCVDGTWVLVAVRILPSVMVAMMDSAVAYQITLLVWGLTRGERGPRGGTTGSTGGSATLCISGAVNHSAGVGPGQKCGVS